MNTDGNMPSLPGGRVRVSRTGNIGIDMAPEQNNIKVGKTMSDSSTSAAGKYKAIYHGDVSCLRVFRTELATALYANCPGPCGLALRKIFYPSLFKACGKGTIFGKNITLRHPSKISVGANVIVDDGVMLDAKGTSNAGISIGNNAFIGRNTIIYCKNGNIKIGDNVNISSNCTIFSSNDLTIENDVIIGAYSYLLSGGEYDHMSGEKFVDQSGMKSSGPLVIGENTWIGTRATVLDAASIGKHCVIGAGTVCIKPVDPDSVAVGVPAKVVKSIKKSQP